MQKTNKVLDTGLKSLMKAPGALSRWGEGTGCFLESWKPGQEGEQDGSLRSRESARERERERETDPSSDGAKVL